MTTATKYNRADNIQSALGCTPEVASSLAKVRKLVWNPFRGSGNQILKVISDKTYGEKLRKLSVVGAGVKDKPVEGQAQTFTNTEIASVIVGDRVELPHFDKTGMIALNGVQFYSVYDGKKNAAGAFEFVVSLEGYLNFQNQVGDMPSSTSEI